MDALLSLLGSFARVEALGGEGSAFVDGREVARFSAFSVAFFGADGAVLRFRADSGDLAWWLGEAKGTANVCQIKGCKSRCRTVTVYPDAYKPETIQASGPYCAEHDKGERASAWDFCEHKGCFTPRSRTGRTVRVFCAKHGGRDFSHAEELKKKARA